MLYLNLTKPVKALDGTDLTEGGQVITQHKVIANQLALGKDSPVKRYDLALRFYSGTPVEVDESDFNFIRQCVEGAGLSALVSAQILKAMDDARIALKVNNGS